MFLKFVIPSRRGHCDYSLRASKNLATPLFQRTALLWVTTPRSLLTANTTIYGIKPQSDDHNINSQYYENFMCQLVITRGITESRNADTGPNFLYPQSTILANESTDAGHNSISSVILRKESGYQCTLADDTIRPTPQKCKYALKRRDGALTRKRNTHTHTTNYCVQILSVCRLGSRPLCFCNYYTHTEVHILASCRVSYVLLNES